MKLKDLKKYLAPNQGRVIKGQRQAKEMERCAHKWLATLGDNAFQEVSITGVSISSDLKLVTLLYLGEAKFTRTVCNNFKHYLSSQVALRRMPDVRFVLDKDYASILRTEEIFKEHVDP
jgi:ribosome-binding factor A